MRNVPTAPVDIEAIVRTIVRQLAPSSAPNAVASDATAASMKGMAAVATVRKGGKHRFIWGVSRIGGSHKIG